MIVGDDECQSNSEKLSQTKISLTNSLTDVNEDLINEKNNEIGRVTKWAIGFEKLLEDKLGLQIFTVNTIYKLLHFNLISLFLIVIFLEFFKKRV